jgi:hypothetical protein
MSNSTGSKRRGSGGAGDGVLVADGRTVARAILELHLDVPIYHAEVVGDHLVLYCFGGRTVAWRPGNKAEVEARAKAEGGSSSPALSKEM